MILVEQLVYKYPNNPGPTVKGISFTVDDGEVFGFLGPSGSGKSTTQKILYKLLKDYEGKVQIDRRDLSSWKRDFYQFVGVGFELPNHYLKLTALENLRFFASFYKNKPNNLKGLLAKVGLADHADKKVADFSKGMKMRLNFIRAFMHDPTILFLDEPTAGLDPVNARVIKDLILDFKQQGKTIFLTTHSMYDADELCDRVALLSDGQILAMDKPADLKLAYGQRRVKVQLKGDRGFKEFDLEKLAGDQEFLEIIQSNAIQTIHSEEASLEDVFIRVTGKSLV